MRKTELGILKYSVAGTAPFQKIYELRVERRGAEAQTLRALGWND